MNYEVFEPRKYLRELLYDLEANHYHIIMDLDMFKTKYGIPNSKFIPTTEGNSTPKDWEIEEYNMMCNSLRNLAEKISHVKERIEYEDSLVEIARKMTEDKEVKSIPAIPPRPAFKDAKF